MTYKETLKPWFNKRLGFLFIVSVMFFSALRWDVESWVQGELDAAILQNHLNITYDTLDLHATSLELSNVRLHLSGMPNTLLLDDVYVQLDWSALWKMRVAAFVKIKNNFIQMRVSISLHDTSIILTDLIGQVDVQAAQAWYGQASLAQATGKMHWQGDVEINLSTGLPVQTDLQISWQNAALNIMQKNYLLGDYVLKLNQIEQSQRWMLQGGEQLQVKGNGVLQMNHATVLMWGLQGNIYVQTGEQSALAALLPRTGGEVNVMGTVGQPQWAM